MPRLPYAAAIASALMSGTAFAAIFPVDTGADIADALPGDGKCSFLPVPPPNGGVCTLRAAIMEANSDAAHDTIVLTDGATYPLTIPGRGEDNAVTGDLDIRQPVRISAGTFGRATVSVVGGMDRVFDIRAVPSPGVTLNGLTISGGDIGDETSKAGGIELNCQSSVWVS